MATHPRPISSNNQSKPASSNFTQLSGVTKSLCVWNYLAALSHIVSLCSIHPFNFKIFLPVVSTTARPIFTTPALPCLCPGAEPVEKCPCKDSQWWDGEYCVERWECPCFIGHISYEIICPPHCSHQFLSSRYSVGSTFNKENCDECVCRMNGVETCSPAVCPPCPYGLRSALTPSCGCVCKSCDPGTLLCHTSGACIPETAWCDGVHDCPDDESNCTAPVEGYSSVLDVSFNS